MGRGVQNPWYWERFSKQVAGKEKREETEKKKTGVMKEQGALV